MRIAPLLVCTLAGTATADPATTAPPKELDEMMVAGRGTWNCKGDEVTPEKKRAITATDDVQFTLDGHFISETLHVRSASPYTMQSFLTYDTAAKQWHRVGIDSRGNQLVGSASWDSQAIVQEFVLTATGSAPGFVRERLDTSHCEVGMAATTLTGATLSVERSADGKTWTPVYELRCNKR